MKRTNEHLHEPDEEAVTCQQVKIGMKRKASETQDSTHLIVGGISSLSSREFQLSSRS